MVELLEKVELNDAISRVKELAERVMMLEQEVNEFVFYADRNKEVKSEGDAHNARMKSDMVLEIISEMQGELEKLDTMTHPSNEPPKDHQDMNKTERVDEILNQIGVFAGMIENFPDWLDRMKTLNFTASCLAMGCKGYNFSCKEPGRD